jgi:hypothetical protein
MMKVVSETHVRQRPATALIVGCSNGWIVRFPFLLRVEARASSPGFRVFGVVFRHAQALALASTQTAGLPGFSLFNGAAMYCGCWRRTCDSAGI